MSYAKIFDAFLYNNKMDDTGAKECFPFPSVLECKASALPMISIFVAFILQIPIFFFTAKSFQIFLTTKNVLYKRIIFFFMLYAYSYAVLIINMLLPTGMRQHVETKYFRLFLKNYKNF